MCLDLAGFSSLVGQSDGNPHRVLRSFDQYRKLLCEFGIRVEHLDDTITLVSADHVQYPPKVSETAGRWRLIVIVTSV